MKDTFTLADLASFELPKTQVEAPPAEPVKQPAESSAAQAETSDEVVETSAETTPATAAEAVPEPESETQEQPPEKYIPKGRFDEVIDERNALRRFNEYLLSKEQAATAAIPVPAAPVAEGAPTLESCQYDTDKWTQAMNAWTQKQIQTGVKQALESERQTQTKEQTLAKFEERMKAAEKAIPNFKTVLGNPALPLLAPDASALVVESEFAPQILFHLGSNPDEAARIARKTPAQQAAAIGRIEGELRAKVKPQQKTPQLTRAPNPPTPNSGRGNTPSVDPSKMSTKEWVAWDRQQEMERRRARKGARSA